MERLYRRLAASQSQNGSDGVRYSLYEELAARHRFA
jgi:hypothetical protein